MGCNRRFYSSLAKSFTQTLITKLREFGGMPRTVATEIFREADANRLPDLQEWTKYLTTNIPSGILSADVNLNLAFEGSTFIILTVPIEVWTMLPMNNENYKFIAHVWRELGLAPEPEPEPSLCVLVRRICPPIAEGEEVDATTGFLSPTERSSLGVWRTTSR